jgi:hypothetical protein
MWLRRPTTASLMLELLTVQPWLMMASCEVSE